MDRNYSSADNGNITTSLGVTTDHANKETVLVVIPVLLNSLDGGWLSRIGITAILLFGTFGNVMTVIILRSLRSGWSAMNVYLTALALSDTAMLYTGALPMWSQKVLDYDVYASHVLVCKLASWTMTTSAALSDWLLVALTAQRAASVVWPHRVNVICTRHKSVVISVVITAVCGLLYSHIVYGFSVVKSGNGTAESCTVGSADYQVFWVGAWSTVSMLIYSIVPCVCLVVSNAVLGWKLAVAMKKAGEKLSTGGEDQKHSRRKKASSVTVTIIIVSVAFVLITIPFMAFNIFFYRHASSDVHYFLYDFFFVFGMSNFAWNFYLYCLTGSRFRDEFKKIVFCCCSCSDTSWARSVCVTEESQVPEGAPRGPKKGDADSNYDF